MSEQAGILAAQERNSPSPRYAERGRSRAYATKLYRGDMAPPRSDGLSGKVAAEELLELALAGPTIEIAGRRMVALANERGGEDNITLILTHFGGPGLVVAPQGAGVTGSTREDPRFQPMPAVVTRTIGICRPRSSSRSRPPRGRLDDDGTDGTAS